MTPASLPDPLQSRYDETPYRDQVFPAFDVARLLGMAQLFGVRRGSPVERGTIRVLDLACASGLHLRQQAARHPSVHFTGIDFSSREIEAGRKSIGEAGLQNVELIHADLRDAKIDEGAFDLILCHGAFSWVPDDVKDRILQLCRFGLSRDGIAAIAYLTYPGWKQKEALRELLAMRVQPIQDPRERVRQSALLLRFLHAGYSAQNDSVHAQSLKATVEGMQKSSANVFLHDELGCDHDPCYFMQFAEWAEECGLQYLAESDLGTMSADGLPESAGGLLRQISPDFLETQQLLDFVVNRSGRSSLLIRSDAHHDRRLTFESVEGLQLSTRLVDVTPLNQPADAPCVFESPTGQRLTLHESPLQRMLRHAASCAPNSLPASELIDGECSTGESSDDLQQALLELVARGLLDPGANLPL